MQRFEAAARALAYAGVAAGAVLATSGSLAATELKAAAPEAQTAPIIVASLGERFADKPSSVTESDSLVPTSSARPAHVRTIITGDASFYEERGKTSSGERYDAKAFTAAAQILLRDQFGGIYYGKNYRPSYGVAEWGGKKAIVKFNDVGPLAPGRFFDFSRAAMEYFDGIDLGVLPHVTVKLLPLGRDYPQGPVTDTQLAAIEEQIAPADVAEAEPSVAVASATGARATDCGGNSLSLQPISFDRIQAKFARTASLDNSIIGADLEQNTQIQAALFDSARPNDLGLVASTQVLP